MNEGNYLAGCDASTVLNSACRLLLPGYLLGLLFETEDGGNK
jgi:hypothetical protein